MKVFIFKHIFARRRSLVYLVLLLLFVGSFMYYEFISNYLQVAVARMQNKRHGVIYSKKDAADQDLRPNLDSSVYSTSQRDDVKENIARLHTEIAVTTDTGFHQMSITEFNRIESKGVDIENLIEEITSKILETMNEASKNVAGEHSQTCSPNDTIGNSCKIGRCLQMQLPGDLRARVKQVVAPSHLQIDDRIRSVLSTMADQVPGYYDFIFVSAVSYSHFEEAQAMLYNIHTHVFPHLTNFTFIYYNLGLSTEQRTFMAKICKCHLIDFPFELLPEFVSFLKCYAWKPLIVNAHISRSNLLFWIDASVRFKEDPHKTVELLNRARRRGIQVFISKQTIAKVTLPSLFHFFGDEACVYANFSVILSGVVLFSNEMFVKRAILEPWVACAMSTECMCPKNVDLRHVRVTCHNETDQYHYGTCHRFDQSALSLLLVKIYQERLINILAPKTDYIDIKRADRIEYPVKGVTIND